ncbi:MAG: 4Fe-4S binding protein [Clostridiales bacterium]
MNRLASKFRWFVMAIFFVFFTFGVHIFGLKVPSKFALPIFSCPINYETSYGGSCFTLCHLKKWVSATTTADIVFFIVFTFITILILGRLLCGYICPVGFIQDVLDKFRQFLKFDQIKFSEKRYKILNIMKWATIIIFFAGGIFWEFSFCSICPILAISPPLAGIKIVFSLSIVFAILFIVLSFFKRRFWCNICPIGYMIGVFHKLSFTSLKKDCQACTECGACYEACPMGIKIILTEREKDDVTTNDCLMCMECINKCPEKDALSLAYFEKKIYKASRKNFFENQDINE